MSDSEGPESNQRDDLPQAVVRDSRQPGRRVSIVWIIPVVAVLVGAGLAWRSWENRGIDIVVTFETANGIVPGQTTARFRGVEIGMVTHVSVRSDLQEVDIVVRMQEAMRPYLVAGKKFWVVRPRVTAAGISGLGTLISGAYIAMDSSQKTGPLVRKFKGLEQPPSDPDGTGLAIGLTSDRLHGLSGGSGLYHRGVQVGAIDRYELTKQGSQVTFYASVPKTFASLVREKSEFHITSGFELTASLAEGFELDVESLRELLAGGLTLENPADAGPPAKTGAKFQLLPELHRPAPGRAVPVGPRFVVEAAQLGSIESGDPVTYRGEKVGTVVNHTLHDDGRSVGIMIGVARRYAPLLRTNSVFWNSSGISADLGLSGLHLHAESLQTLLAGGIAFANPTKPGTPAAAGSVFTLHDKPPKHHEDWKPRIWIGPPSKDPEPSTDPPESQKVHHKGEAAGDENSHHWFNKLFHRNR
ncbi:MAG: MlaD family protein [Myxococcota bacterium]